MANDHENPKQLAREPDHQPREMEDDADAQIDAARGGREMFIPRIALVDDAHKTTR